jgi:sterol desaturase/sphingolipid hydroxylase (fatty acid hydroxylase superfamily)
MTAPTLSLALLAGLPLGAVLWTFMEYVLHRFAFHEARGSNYGSREHLRHHGSEDTVLESWYLSWAGVLLVSLALIPFLGRLAGQPTLGWGVGVGYLLAYGFYDLVHWRAHRRPIANAYEARVRKHHFVHHFHAPLQNHGVTTAFWDRVFGTLVEVEKVRVPRRMAMRWLLDEDGEVRPEYRDTYELRGSRQLSDAQREADRELAFANQAPVV